MVAPRAAKAIFTLAKSFTMNGRVVVVNDSFQPQNSSIQGYFQSEMVLDSVFSGEGK